MIIFKSASELSSHLQALQSTGKTIGFVPTMGALHAGHLSLLTASQQENDQTVCSIFINPTQFNNQDDFNQYPVTIEKDIEALVASQCDILFLPSVKEIYPDNHVKKPYDLGVLEHVLEGHYRPGHFQGVCEVVDRLLTIVNPDRLYLGQKDYQQCMVIKKLVELTGRLTPQLRFINTKREQSGLAMSSRNLRLNADETEKAQIISEALEYIKQSWLTESISTVKEKAGNMLRKKGFQIDYVEIADATNLLPLLQYENEKKAIALVAASINNIRLIDNMLLN
jgi:pantoate--beta-alanine ligase